MHYFRSRKLSRPSGRSGLKQVGLAVVALLLALSIVACGSSSGGGSSSSDSTTGSADGGSGGIDLDAAKVLKENFAGVVEKGPTSGPKAQAGKNVWLLSCLEFEGCQRITNGMTEAAKELGWNLHVVNTKAEPNLTIAAMRQAISANADGIIELPIDCPLIKSGLLAAKQAGVPVVAYGGLDCDNPVFHGGQPLFAADVEFNGKDWAQFYGKTGEKDAEVVLALAKEQGIEDPKIIQVRNDDQALQHEHSERFAKTIEAKCPDCSLYPLSFTVPQLGEGKGPEIFKSGVLAHPDADVLYYHASAWLPSGLQAAILSAGHKFEVLCCGDGGQGDFQNIRDELAPAYAADAYPSYWAGWAVLDVLNRVFAGETKMPYEGGESLFVDKTHNLPEPEEFANGSYDFKAPYQKVWNGG